MSPDSLLSMQSRQLPFGAVQWSMPFSTESLLIEDFASEALLLPQHLQFAIKKRQIEFLSGRLCAKRCLQDLGVQDSYEVLVGEDRSPIWPSQWIGSISHTEGLASAVVGSVKQIAAIGLDIERTIKDATPQMIKHICFDTLELENLADRLQLSTQQALTLIFSSKESLYKASYPRLQRYAGFQTARVDFDISNQLCISLTTDLSDRFLKGRTWPVLTRQLGEDLLETMVIEANLDGR